MKQNNRPAIGTKMYSVHEHRYYILENTAPILEYCVCEAEVKYFYETSRTWIKLHGSNPNGYKTVFDYRLTDIGKSLFYTPAEAAQLAKRKTEQYERAWAWLGAPYIPMRRPWEKCLVN